MLENEIENWFIIFITLSGKKLSRYDFENFEDPILTFVIADLPGKDKVIDHNIFDQYVRFKVSVFEKEGALIYGPINVKINDRNWRTFSAEIKSKNGFIKNYSHINNQGKLHDISAMCKLDEMDQHVTSFNQIISSVRLAGE